MKLPLKELNLGPYPYILQTLILVKWLSHQKNAVIKKFYIVKFIINLDFSKISVLLKFYICPYELDLEQ